MKKAIKFIISLVVCQLAGVIGSFFTISSVSTWYLVLNKPSFNPPSWIFSPVWISLFILMGIALFLVWEKGLKKNKIAVSLFAIQLVLNIFWSVLFFGLKSPLAALIEIIILWTAILLTMIYFYRISKLSGWLMLPYLLWVSFATVLNLFIVVLN
ncbi:MAG: TspO/MBR family protein [Candidatus Woesearchaeota archaeon]